MRPIQFEWVNLNGTQKQRPPTQRETSRNPMRAQRQQVRKSKKLKMKTKTENNKAMRGEANENECCLNLKTKRGQRTVNSGQWRVWKTLTVNSLTGFADAGSRSGRSRWRVCVVVNAIDGDDATFLCQVQ